MLTLLAATFLLAQADPLPQAEQVPIDGPLDHRDQWGVTAALGATYLIDNHPLSAASDYNPGLVPTLEIGATRAVADLGELHLRVRLFDDSYLRPWFFFGYRAYSSEGPLTTFFDLDASWATGHDWALGARGAVGLQWDPVRSFGLFLSLGAGVAIGSTYNISFEGLFGPHVRF